MVLKMDIAKTVSINYEANIHPTAMQTFLEAT